MVLAEGALERWNALARQRQIVGGRWCAALVACDLAGRAIGFCHTLEDGSHPLFDERSHLRPECSHRADQRDIGGNYVLPLAAVDRAYRHDTRLAAGEIA